MPKQKVQPHTLLQKNFEQNDSTEWIEAGPLVTYYKYNCIGQYVHDMSVKDKRKIFHIMRTRKGNADTFLPQHGITIGEFSTYYTFQENSRKKI